MIKVKKTKGIKTGKMPEGCGIKAADMEIVRKEFALGFYDARELILERDIEKYLVKQVKIRGGEVRKLAWIGRAHAPDRLVMLNGPHFVELKAPGKKPRAGQAREFKRMDDHGVRVWVLSTHAEVDDFMYWALIEVNQHG